MRTTLHRQMYSVRHLLALSLAVLTSNAYAISLHKEPVLRFNKDGLFTIVQFTDIHWHDGSPEDLQTAELMGSVLDQERPDLVALTGDIIGGSKCRKPETSFPRCVAPIIEREIPWAFTFGNHDDECRLSRDEIMDLVRSLPYAMSKQGPRDITGVSNYMIPIRAAKGRRQAATLYFLDSNSYADPEHDNYDWIRPGQIQWYRETAKRIRKRNEVEGLPALAFFHIPLPEYNDVWDAGVCVGSKQESVCCPKINSGFFAALLEAGDVMATFVGHDHVNDYEGDWYGVRLCYGRASGYTAYGREGFPRGARVIQLTQGKRTFQTWFRLETGEKVVLSDAQGAVAESSR